MFKLNWWTLIVIALVSIAFLMRISSLFYGLPLQLSIDEPSLVSAVIALKENLNPGRFDWPHLYFYFNFLFYGIGYVLNSANVLPESLGDIGIYFIISRILSVLFGCATIILIYFVTNKIYQNKYISLIAVSFVTFLPVHVFESRLAKLDIALTFFVTIAFYYIYKVYKDPSYRNFIIAGLLIGIAMSVKYNAFLLYLSLLLAFVNRADVISLLKNYRSYLKFIIAGVSSILAFVIGTPFAVLDFKDFWSSEPRVGVLWQFQNVGNVPWSEYANHVYNTFFVMYQNDFGIGIWLIFIVLVFLYLFFNYRNPIYNFTLLPAILISVYISKLDRSPPHYFIFLLPLYIIPMAHFIYEMLRKLSTFRFSKYINNNVKVIIILLVLAPSIYMSVVQTVLYSRADTRLLAYNWFKNNVTENEYHVYVAGSDIETVIFQIKRSDKVKRIDPDVFKELTPFILVLSAPNISSDYLKSKNWDPPEFSGSSENVLSEAEVLYEVANDYRMGPNIMIFKVSKLLETPDD